MPVNKKMKKKNECVQKEKKISCCQMKGKEDENAFNMKTKVKTIL